MVIIYRKSYNFIEDGYFDTPIEDIWLRTQDSVENGYAICHNEWLNNFEERVQRPNGILPAVIL